uniref:MHC class II beta chain N-terminal domain-containing protein n=1 Tax=Otus sunia TaxID=257818 RepID=A0A8C8AG04_9STRI
MGRGHPVPPCPPRDGLPAHTGVFLEMYEAECQYLNGTERVRFVMRFIHNREQLVHFDSDVGLFVADTPLGEFPAQYWNSNPDLLEQERAEVDRFCRKSYEVSTPFITERKGERVAARCPRPGTSRAP